VKIDSFARPRFHDDIGAIDTDDSATDDAGAWGLRESGGRGNERHGRGQASDRTHEILPVETAGP